MGLLRFTNMTTRATPPSGSFKQPQSGRVIKGPAPKKAMVLPQVLAYPHFHPLDATLSLIKDRLCYVIRHYGYGGLSVLIVRNPKDDKTAVLCGDWKGNSIDIVADSSDPLTQAALVFINDDLKLFLEAMYRIKLLQGQFFFAIDADANLTLVDLQISLNKFAGPGFIRDLFGRAYRTQEVLKVEVIDDRAIEYIGKATGNYEGDLLLKPSKFTSFNPTTTITDVPLYIEIKR